jgi:hypothetical protein
MLVNVYVCNITIGGAASVEVENFTGMPAQGWIERISVKCTDGNNGGAPYDLQGWSGDVNNSTFTEGAVASQIINEGGITALGIAATGAGIGSADMIQFPHAYFCNFSGTDLSSVSPTAASGMNSGTFTFRIDSGGAGNGKAFQVGLIIRSPEVALQKDHDSYALYQELS